MPVGDSSDALVFDMSRRMVWLSKRMLLPEDDLAFRFARLLEDFGIKYVVVAGYIAILFGRSRRSDDIDFILEHLDEEDFLEG